MDLLLTKFHKPHGEGPGCSPRSSLDYGTLPPAWQVLLLSAPAGFGKTSLLGQWMEHCGGETAFLSLDAYDNEPRRFWNYFIASVNRVLPDAGKGVLSLLNTPELPEIENCLIPFINDLHERESGLIMVLDDLHAIEEPAIFRGLDFLLDNLPESVRFIFSTREDPPISLGRLRAKGRLCEIRQHDLRFSEDEACRFLNRGLDAKLSREDCLSLFKRTEGWVTGLQLVKSALRQQKDRAAFIRSFSGSHNYVFDYLLEEVMERLDGETATFLLESSLFDEFSAPLCDDYLGRKTGDSIKRIGRANLFLIPLDDEGIWFRYHHLFLDFLRNRLREGLSGEEMKEKYRRACTVLKEHQRYDDAFEMGVRGEFWEECVKLLAARIPDYYREVRLHDLERQISRIPEAFLSLSADLFAISRYNRIGIEHDDRRFTGEMTPLLQGVNELLRGYRRFYYEGEIRGCREAFLRSQELIPDEYGELNNTGSLLAGAILRIEGQLRQAEKEFLFDLKPDRFQRRFYSSLLQTVNRVELYRAMGEISRAGEVLEESCRMIGELSHNHGLVSTSYLWVEKAQIALAQNRLNDAYSLIRQGVTLCRIGDSEEAVFLSVLVKARIEEALGMYGEEGATLRACEEELGDSSPISAVFLKAQKASLDIKTGGGAQVWAKECGNEILKLGLGDPLPAFLFEKYYIYSLYLMDRDDLKGAQDCLDKLMPGLRESGQISYCIRILVRKACVEYRLKHGPEAARLIKDALDLNGGERNLRVFLDAGEEVPYLLAEAERKGYLPDFLKEHTREDSKRKKVLLEINDYEETFNDRELDIIRYMGEGFSNQEISDRIFLSVNTVRWYARQIYAKLDVKRRGEAVARAKALGLV